MQQYVFKLINKRSRLKNVSMIILLCDLLGYLIVNDSKHISKNNFLIYIVIALLFIDLLKSKFERMVFQFFGYLNVYDNYNNL